MNFERHRPKPLYVSLPTTLDTQLNLNRRKNSDFDGFRVTVGCSAMAPVFDGDGWLQSDRLSRKKRDRDGERGRRWRWRGV
ncbi:unnamed protein product [Prunus armeniaca]|uniref:Uncharacterized protein n=1 Tax=Prunus armeniaca TaxID=36596 RepID=A0A6J5TGM3_PRUAR|nr:unnamed protein product [Prunus armeniaca]